jgi:hypothetical protein
MGVSSFFRGWGIDAEKTGGRSQLGNNTAQACLKPPRFRGSKFGRNNEGSQALQRLADALQAPLAVRDRGRGAGAGVGLCPDKAKRVLEEGAPFRGAGHAIGGQQRESLAERQAVALGAAQQGLLVAAVQRTQRMGEGGADTPLSEGLLGLG